MSYESEKMLEDKLIKQLESQDYEYIKIDNKEELYENFRNQLFKYNQVALKDKPFTDSEFKKIIAYIEGKSIFNSAKILRDTFPLERDNGEIVRIEFLNMKNGSWCKNLYQVTHQITMEGRRTNRYDVTILINGLPLVQIELKRRGIAIKEAFNQVLRYKKDSFTGLFKYTQLFIISNGVNTKYFANSDKKPEYVQTFYWTNEKNERISSLTDFADDFLEPCTISEIISRYMIINETNKALMVMRPYQIYAVKAAMTLIRTNHEQNGYIWHTTGSGKTLTSFKLSQLLSRMSGISKVFFLVDRRDLDNQTTQEFNKFEKGCVDETNSTYSLIEQIKKPTRPLIVTTIQKLNHAVKSGKYSDILSQYKDEKIVFIMDECHRSQFGDMHKEIAKYFTSAQYIGFTGTPILEENKSSDGRMTTDIFHKCLHTYLINDAINDGNVLGFSVEYINTIKDKSNKYDVSMAESINEKEVFTCKKRIDKIAKHIVDIHNTKTNNKKFTAMLTVPDIDTAIKYYDSFKKLEHDLKITTIYTYGPNSESESNTEDHRDSLDRIIKDYNDVFDTEYSTDTFKSYFFDVSKRVKDAEIDILIVVGMFLTGFDAKTLNTLYVDKELEYHNLLQAFSRTNRTYGSEKPYGNIVCYRNLKEKVDEAVYLFSQSDSCDVVLMKSYKEYLKEFKEKLKRLNAIAPTVSSTDNLKGEEDKKEFVVSFRELTRVLNKLKTFTEFEFTEDELGISEQLYEEFRSKYLDMYDIVQKSDKISILNDIDFEIELLNTDKIDVDYIMKLIKSINLENKKNVEKKTVEIKKYLDKSANKSLRLKIELLKEFLDKVIPNMSVNSSIDIELDNYMVSSKEKELYDFATANNLDLDILKDLIHEQEFAGFIKNESFNKIVKNLKFLERRRVEPIIKDFIIEHIDRFTY